MSFRVGPYAEAEDFADRTLLLLIQMDRVLERADVAARDLDGRALEAAQAEAEVLIESLRRIREEQLLAEMRRRARRGWLRRWWR